MQVDPIKPTLKVSGTNFLTPNHDEPLSTFAFNFKLRRYTEERAVAALARTARAEMGTVLGTWTPPTLNLLPLLPHLLEYPR